MRRSIYATVFLLILAISGWALADGVASPEPPALAPNLAGSETRLLPANVDIWSCDWSPSGKTLIFAAKMQGEDNGKMRIWYWNQEPIGDPAPLTNTEQLIDFTPRWAPDGTRIALVRRSLGKPSGPTVTSAVWLKEFPGGAGRQLTNGPEDRDPFWSPDGTQLVFSRAQGPYRAQLCIINVADGSVVSLAGGEGDLLNSPWWGIDGKIYFTRLRPFAKTVAVANQNYSVMEFGKGGIWSWNPADNAVQPVVVDEYDNRVPAVSSNGQWLAYISNRVQSKDKEGNGKFDRGSLYLKNLATGSTYYLTNKVALVGGSLAWSPDGRKLAFFTYRSIRPAVWVITLPETKK